MCYFPFKMPTDMTQFAKKNNGYKNWLLLKADLKTIKFLNGWEILRNVYNLTSFGWADVAHNVSLKLCYLSWTKKTFSDQKGSVGIFVFLKKF